MEAQKLDYYDLISGMYTGIKKMKLDDISLEEFDKRFDSFKGFNYKSLDDDESFWEITYIMFFNIGRKASMIEAKLPILKKYLYGYNKLAISSESDISLIVNNTGFRPQVERVVANARTFQQIINKYGSFDNYLSVRFGIEDIHTSPDNLDRLSSELSRIFKGYGVTAPLHLITELGFDSIKPDSVVCRIMYRRGLIDDIADIGGAIEIGRAISKDLNLPIRYVDVVIVKFGQVGPSATLGTKDGICTENSPKCNICTIKHLCRHHD
jgi:DNA-3-methyladenine glycosylase I